MCPGCAPGLRPLFFRGEQRRRCVPARPSEEGGLEEWVEFFLRAASCRSRSAICFSASAIRRSRSDTWSRSFSISHCCRSTCRCSSSRLGGGPYERRLALDCWLARRAALAFIHHTLNYSARFVQENRSGHLNCRKNKVVNSCVPSVGVSPGSVAALGQRMSGRAESQHRPDSR
jgi:hypothetical protein